MREKRVSIRHRQFEVDYYGHTSNGKQCDVAIIVLNRNLPVVTDELCNTIINTTHSPFDLFVTESGSDRERLSRYCSLHFVDDFSIKIGLRIAKGINASIEIIDQINPGKYKYYWFLTNDVILKDGMDYVETARSIFSQYHSVGIIEPCYQPGEYYTLNYHAAKREPCIRRLRDESDYTRSIRSKGFSIIPFPIIRSIFFTRELIDDLGYLADETNWRNWGNDEDLGYRAWKKGWWVVTTPFRRIWEDMFLSTRLSSETRTEEIEIFKKQAELDMHRFLKEKYAVDVKEFRVMVYKEMLNYLEVFDRDDIDLAHCITSGTKSIYNLIREVRS